MKRVPRDVYNGPVQIQVDENRGVIWVNSGKDGRCLIRICKIPNLTEMLNRRLWVIDIVAARDDSCCWICGHEFVSPYLPSSRADAGAFTFGGRKICGDCGDALKVRR